MPTSLQFEKYSRPLDYLAFVLSSFLDQNPNFLEESFQKDPSFFHKLHAKLKEETAAENLTADQAKALYKSMYLSFLTAKSNSDCHKYNALVLELQALTQESTGLLRDLDINQEIYERNHTSLSQLKDEVRETFSMGEVPNAQFDELMEASEQLDQQNIALQEMQNAIKEVHRQIRLKEAELQQLLPPAQLQRLFEDTFAKANAAKAEVMNDPELKRAFVQVLMKCRTELTPQMAASPQNQQNRSQGRGL